MKLVILKVMLLIMSFSATASVEIKLGGWSYHAIEGGTDDIVRKYIDSDFQYNESHDGLGLKFRDDCYEWCSFIEYWNMRASFNKQFHSLSIGQSKHYDVGYFDSLELNLGVSVIRRTFVKWGDDYAEYTEINIIVPSPYITLHKDRFNIDFMIGAYKADTGWAITPFVRIGYEF